MYEIRFTVQGAGQFPIDMMRYDRATPYTEQDSARADGRGMRSVNMVMYRKYKHDATPTVGRWSSFGWEVVNVEVPQKVT